MKTTIFMNGQSQAIRIPKEFRLNGRVCDIQRRGKELISGKNQNKAGAIFPRIIREPRILKYHGITLPAEI